MDEPGSRQSQLPPDFAGLRVALVGIGNELNGDDAAGMLAVKLLRARLAVDGVLPDRLLIIEAGPAPESFSGPLRRFHPDAVLFIDAAQLDEPPGTVCWIDWTEVADIGGSTHTLSPSLFARFLASELGCRVLLAAIQPAHLDFDRPVSAQVQQSVRRLVDDLTAQLG